MKFQNKLYLLMLLFTVAVFFASPACWAVRTGAHQFQTQSWSNNQSCTVCHIVKNGLPSYVPPGSRLTVDANHLTESEAQAVELHPSNRLCFVCHKTNTDLEGNLIEHSPVGSFDASELPGYQEGSRLAQSEGNGTHGSVAVRVNSRGPKGVDCLSCHDVHNSNARSFLRADYDKTQINP